MATLGFVGDPPPLVPLHPSPSHLLSIPPSIPSISTSPLHRPARPPLYFHSPISFPPALSFPLIHLFNISLILLTHPPPPPVIPFPLSSYTQKNTFGTTSGETRRMRAKGGREKKQSEPNTTIRPSLIPVNKSVSLSFCVSLKGANCILFWR